MSCQYHPRYAIDGRSERIERARDGDCKLEHTQRGTVPATY